jgi:hypothetical protein
MAEYKDIKGFKVQTVSTDPAANALGQVFYNSTSDAFKVTNQSVSNGTWASGGNVNTARTNGTGGGVQTAGLFSGGESPSPSSQTLTETYDGTSWTEVNDLNSGRVYAFGAGLQNAAWTAGGYNPSSPLTYRTETEFWDGTSWTIVPATLNTPRAQGMSAGVQTSAIAACGESPGPDPRTFYNNAEELDGTTWTNVAPVNRSSPAQSKRFGSTNIGRSASAMRIVGGGYSETPTTVGFNEEFNGTSWTEETDLNTARGARPGSSGSVNDGLLFGGGPNWSVSLTNTEYWNGTSWTELNDLATATNFGGSGGITSNSALIASGYSAPVGAFDYTQEWNVTTTNSTLTAS